MRLCISSEGARTIDQMPLDATVGRARVIQIDDPKSIKREELLPHAISAGERILFKTANSANAWDERSSSTKTSSSSRRMPPGISPNAAFSAWASIIFQSADSARTARKHTMLCLKPGIWIIEGLNLRGVEPGEYELACLPLRLIGSEGAPARAILRQSE